MSNRDPWTLDEALPVIRKLMPVCKRLGYQLSLTGSVLWEGRSTKDLDLQMVSLEASFSLPAPSQILATIAQALSAEVVGHCEESLTREGIRAGQLLLNNRVIDMQIVNLRLRDLGRERFQHRSSSLSYA